MPTETGIDASWKNGSVILRIVLQQKDFFQILER